MENQDSQVQATESHGSSRLIAFESARFKEESKRNDPYIEVSIDIANDSAALQVHNIKGTPDQEAAFLATCLAKRPSLSSQLSSKFTQVSREIRSSFSSSKKTNSNNKLAKHCPSGTAQALVGLRFMHNNVGNNDGWSEVEARFNQLSVDGMLPRSCFCKCIGNKVLLL